MSAKALLQVGGNPLPFDGWRADVLMFLGVAKLSVPAGNPDDTLRELWREGYGSHQAAVWLSENGKCAVLKQPRNRE